MSQLEYFHAAAFAPGGELIGSRIRQLSELSPKWLEVCETIINEHGPSFRISPGQMLSHIEIKLTSSSGAGLGMFFVNGVLVLSTAYFLGRSSQAESQIQAMLLTSLRANALVKKAAVSDAPFEALLGIEERPLCVFIFWNPPGVSEADQKLVVELSEHFAGAFFIQGDADSA